MSGSLPCFSHISASRDVGQLKTTLSAFLHCSINTLMPSNLMTLTHGARPVGCWAPKEVKVAVDQTSGRDRLNIHGAIDLETGRTRMIEVLTVDAMSTIALLIAIEALYPGMQIIHVFLDTPRFHPARAIQEWLAIPGPRLKRHFVPTNCPHLNPNARLRGLIHKTGTHNRCNATYNGF